MLKNIHLHLDENEQIQARLDEELAEHITKTHKENVNAFQRYIPAILNTLNAIERKSIAVFNNKYGEFNLVDFSIGKAFYGFHPVEEISKQVDHFYKYPMYVPIKNIDIATNKERESDATLFIDEALQNASTALKQLINAPSIKDTIECLVVLGCGLGVHIEQLIERSDIKHLIIYEAEPQYLSNSVSVVSWKNILETAKRKGTNLFVQVDQDGRDLLSDIQQLTEHFQIKGFHVYKHYHHLVYDSVYDQLLSTPWDKLVSEGLHFNATQSVNKYCPPWLPQIDLSDYQLCSTSLPLYQKNLVAFKKYFPDIAEQFESYEPSDWLPILSNNGEVNILEKDKLAGWYSTDTIDECKLNYESFRKHPLKDGLVLGYKGKKLAHYEHNQFVKATEDLIERVREESGLLPEDIQSIIIFGLGVGYQLEDLVKEHNIENLFICEPNRDFFYASLFAVDWESILSDIDKSEHRIYLNIGDDGTNLFRDLLSQFHVIGPYILNNTYFYQSYYNAALNTAIAQLREQLKVVIAMGENFDHAYYGISQTLEGLKQDFPLLTSRPNKKLTYDNQETPIFLVGNGPSLDHSIEYIKEYRDKVIVVSCGTSLKVLHSNNITPDFHAEIEQNRTTYDWASLIGDKEYLKQVSLISCNGVHPDTVSLYKDVYISFKEGESSTISSLEILGRSHFEVLEDAFPTVANFATNLFSVLGFKSLYFIGIDLGFIDNKHHHSKSSSYYNDDGSEFYDYAEANNTSIQVPGNFRPQVYTKHEFKISKEILEHIILKKSKECTFYNCSDGAKVNGTHPLQLDDILITTSSNEKQLAVENIKNKAYQHKSGDSIVSLHREKFDPNVLEQELINFEEFLETPIDSRKQGASLIADQKEKLFNSYQNGNSLLFYYLYGTVNYANAVLSKLLHTLEDETQQATFFHDALETWKQSFKQISRLIRLNKTQFDTSSFQLYGREMSTIAEATKGRKLLVVTDSHSLQLTIRKYRWLINQSGLRSITFCSPLQLDKLESETFDYSIYFIRSPKKSEKLEESANWVLGKESNVYMMEGTIEEAKSLTHVPNGFCIMPIYLDEDQQRCSVLANIVYLGQMVVNVCISKHTADFIIPQYSVKEGTNYLDSLPSLHGLTSTDIVYKFFCNYWCVHKETNNKTLVSAKGTRGSMLSREFEKEMMVSNQMIASEFISLIEAHIKVVDTAYADIDYENLECIELH